MSGRKNPQINEERGLKLMERVKKPDMYKVIMLNDDFTTMEFVVDVLVFVFQKSAAQATNIMLDIHRKGKGLAGVYTYDIAATKVDIVHNMAKKHEFPLKCTIEKE